MSKIYRGIEIPDGWLVEKDTGLLYRIPLKSKCFQKNQNNTCKYFLNGYDFDGTLATRSFRKPSEASIIYPWLIQEMVQISHGIRSDKSLLSDKKTALAILSNESVSRYKNPDVISKVIYTKCKRIDNILKDYDLFDHVAVYLALDKESVWHKSKQTGAMWFRAVNDLCENNICNHGSMYTGDDMKDDAALAKVVGVKFRSV